MKKLLTVLLLLMSLLSFAQDEKPTDSANFKYLQSPFFFYNLPDSSVWISKNQRYGWTKLDRAKDPWYLKMLLGQDTVILPIHKKDTLNLPVYKLKGDSIQFSGYITHSRLKQKIDSLMLFVYTRNYLDSVIDTKQDTLHNPVVQGDSTIIFATPYQLSTKIDEVIGKTLPDNNFTDADSTALANLSTNLSLKLDTTKATALMRENWNTAYSWGDHSMAGYLTSAELNGYATQMWVGNQGYVTGTPWSGMGFLTSASLSGYTTESWVNAKGYITGYTESDPTIYAWAKASLKPSYTFNEVGAAPSSTVSFPGFGATHILAAYGDHLHSEYVTGTPWSGMGYLTSTSLSGYATLSWVNAKGYITGYTESDPNIYAWAKASVKPTYTYTEVGAAPSSTVSFPGFGTTHILAAYGDHTHAGYQTALSGTGFIKISGSTISYDNSTYVTGTPWTSPFTNSGTITAVNFQLSSDRRLKENVMSPSKTDLIRAGFIDFKKFNFKNNPTQRYGVIAQEVELFMPELVTTDETGLKAVSYIDLLIAKIAELESRLKLLEDEK
jgi:hypothetical protein